MVLSFNNQYYSNTGGGAKNSIYKYTNIQIYKRDV